MQSKRALGQIVSDHPRHGHGCFLPSDANLRRTDQSIAYTVEAIVTNAIGRNMRQLPNFRFATAVLFVAATAASAAPPDLRTPAPVIYLADNLDEADELGWCIDTIGRGLSDRLHAHSCKPRGGDVQFRFAETTGQIVSVAFEGKCMANLHPEDSSEPLGLVDCDAAARAQGFIYDSGTMTIRPSGDETRCLSVSADSRSAGPFMARDLRFSECSDAHMRFQQWNVRQ